MHYFYGHASMPKIVTAPGIYKYLTLIDMNRKDDSDVRSQMSYVSEIMRKKKKIFGLNDATLELASQYANHKNEDSAKIRSLTLAPSTLLKKERQEGPSPFIGRESDKYKDITKERIVTVVNNNHYHRRNDLSNYTYNTLTGRYY